MIKVTREFANEREAAAWLLNGSGNAVVNTAPNPAPAPTPMAPAGVSAPQVAAPAPALTPPAPPAGAPVTQAAPAPTAAGHNITAAQIATAAQAYSKANKPAATKAVFAKHGITKVSEANPAIYPQLLADLAV